MQPFDTPHAAPRGRGEHAGQLHQQAGYIRLFTGQHLGRIPAAGAVRNDQRHRFSHAPRPRSIVPRARHKRNDSSMLTDFAVFGGQRVGEIRKFSKYNLITTIYGIDRDILSIMQSRRCPSIDTVETLRVTSPPQDAFGAHKVRRSSKTRNFAAPVQHLW
jgi:hypothetical protein